LCVVDDNHVAYASPLEVGAIFKGVEMHDHHQPSGIDGQVLQLGVHSMHRESYLVYDIEYVSSQAKPFVW
jgi:hypothetical protein